MAREGLSRDDIAGLLLHLGKDCAGALSVLPAGSPPVKVPGNPAADYRVLPDEKLIEIVTALRDRQSLPQGTTDPSPLAGVQSKIALTILPDNRFAEPIPGSGAPTTHILKVPGPDHSRDAVHEAAALDLSRIVGCETCDASAIGIGNVKALIVSRFDRALNEQGHFVRIHQEDFAQALGLPAELKYERNGTAGRRFDAASVCKILEATSNPLASKDSFIAAVLFDLVTGNVDNHAKNFAILHDRSGGIHLAPRYDLLPTRLDLNLTDELAFRIGQAKTLNEISAEDLDQFLAALNVKAAAARKRILQRHLQSLAGGLCEVLDTLTKNGMKLLADLIASNLRHLLPLLDLPVPSAAANRDAFVTRGGGWLNG